ncbi:hypothetical protein [Pseudomonas sp. C11]|uniref:hypothetical protein n=1 Tax=Pseudomonas sp. C11 TaxID=3075550 RepID=UPI002AFE8362|nr:hypothetical protein [Pseudomonas sp. C11]
MMTAPVNCVVMANHPNLQQYLTRVLDWEFSRGPVDFALIRNFVSSPRLMSFSIKAFSHPALCPAGDTYLDTRTMLADYPQKSFALALGEWEVLKMHVEFVNEFTSLDASVMNIQVWPFDPRLLDDFQMVVAVALSYTSAELTSESRISLAINELVQQWGYYTDEF